MKNRIKPIIAIIILFFAILLFLSSKWVIMTFGLITPDELIFHLKVPLQGTSSEMINSFIKESLVPAACITLFLVILFRWKSKTEAELQLKIFRVNKRVIFSPQFFIKRHSLFFSVCILFFCVGYGCITLNIQRFVLMQFSDSSFINDHFVDSKTTKVTFPAQKRNLIYIYLESMENTYFSKDQGGAQEVDLASEIYSLAESNINFSNTNKVGGAFQAPATGWTVAGMVAQTSGLPLKLPFDSNTYSYDTYLPGVKNLGDILNENGYKQVLLLGSDAEFAGRKTYFQEHGNYDMFDYYSAINSGKIPKDYHVWWGYEDEKLFEYAKEQLKELSQSSAPFNLTFLTADTHHPEGYVCQLCENEHDSQFANVISCSSRQVSNFVKWVQQQDFYKNTTIVIAGDHLSMNTSFFTDLDDSYERTTMNIIINSPVKPAKTKYRDFCTFDMFPTTLASLGASIDGNRLGLGTNLFSETPTLAETVGKDTLNEELEKRSSFYDNTFLYAK